MAFYSDAIGHAALTGVAIGVILGVGDPLWAMIGFAVLLALGITAMRRCSAAATDTAIGVTMALTMALGVVLLSRGGGFARYARYLIGDVLTVTPAEIRRMGVLAAGVLVAWGFLFNRIFFVTVNRSLARSRGMRVWAIEALFAALVAVVVTVCIPWVGLLVVNSLFILPAAAARNVARNTPAYYALALVLSLLSGVLGLIGSFYWGTAAGATIVLFAAGFFLLTMALRAALERRRGHPRRGG
jgi:zinc transport system permease protein